MTLGAERLVGLFFVGLVITSGKSAASGWLLIAPFEVANFTSSLFVEGGPSRRATSPKQIREPVGGSRGQAADQQSL
jgi:hypothetical protein